MVSKVFRVTTMSDIALMNRIASLAGLQPYPLDQSRFLIENPSFLALVLIAPAISRLPVGYAVLQASPPEGEILDIAVLPPLQRMGLGARLLKAALALFSTNEVEECYLEVRRSNRPAVLFYQEYGFKCRSMRKDYYSFPKEDALLMYRSLREKEEALFLS